MDINAAGLKVERTGRSFNLGSSFECIRGSGLSVFLCKWIRFQFHKNSLCEEELPTNQIFNPNLLISQISIYIINLFWEIVHHRI